MVEDIGARVDDLLCSGDRLAQKIRGQDLNGGPSRRGAYCGHRGREVSRSAIVKIITVNRRYHDVLETHCGNGMGYPRRFRGIERIGQAGGDITEGAGAGAGLAHDHHSGVRLGPALADVGTGRLFAHGDETIFLHDLAGGVVAGGARRSDAEPSGLALHGRIGTRLLLGVAQTSLGRSLDDCSHEA